MDLEDLFANPKQSRRAAQTSAMGQDSNRLLGFTQTLTDLTNGQPGASTSTRVHYGVDANGAMTTDGLREFEYDSAGRLAKVKIGRGGEAAAVTYLHNALGQRVFKGEPKAEQTLPSEDELGSGFVSWLRKSFGWLFVRGHQVNYGDIFVYGDGQIPSWALMGEYGNGSAIAKDATEYIWLPTEDGGAIPIGLYRSGKLHAVHADHLGTPRLITNHENKPVWQWPYSVFGNNKPTGVLAATLQSNGQTTLKGTKPQLASNLRLPGQYFDEESNLSYNYWRSCRAFDGRYTQFDPIGLRGGLNGYAYVGASPLMFTDPMGLDATDWSNTAGGRSRWDGPTNGNWGGKCWSGGQYSCGPNLPGKAPPADSGDQCYERHDNCHVRCRADKNCIAACDKTLVDELRLLPDDPRQWPTPPRPGTEADSRRYRDNAIRYFR